MLLTSNLRNKKDLATLLNAQHKTKAIKIWEAEWIGETLEKETSPPNARFISGFKPDHDK